MTKVLAAPLALLLVSRAAMAAEPALPAAPAPVEPVTPLVATAPPPFERGDVAPIVGALTAAVPFFVGCALWSVDDRRELQRAGTWIMATGFAAAPWVAHGLHGRWRRAAAYGSISAALSAATLGLMAWKDPFYTEYKNRERVPFGILLSTAMFAGAIGVIDSFVVGPAPGDGQ